MMKKKNKGLVIQFIITLILLLGVTVFTYMYNNHQSGWNICCFIAGILILLLLKPEIKLFLSINTEMTLNAGEDNVIRSLLIEKEDVLKCIIKTAGIGLLFVLFSIVQA